MDKFNGATVCTVELIKKALVVYKRQNKLKKDYLKGAQDRYIKDNQGKRKWFRKMTDHEILVDNTGYDFWWGKRTYRSWEERLILLWYIDIASIEATGIVKVDLWYR